jgi:peroxiredoxin
MDIERRLIMEMWFWASYALLWVLVLAMGFLLLGVLRLYGILVWRLEELAATTPNRAGRTGLKPGTPAPDFTLPQVGGGVASLRDFSGQPVLVVFVQPGCGPCHAIVPELNALARKGDPRVVVVLNADPETAREWTEEVGSVFPVLIQERWQVSKRFEVYATPFAFSIDASGMVWSAGLVGSRQQLGYVLGGAGRPPGPGHPKPDRVAAKGKSGEFQSEKEVSDV